MKVYFETEIEINGLLIFVGVGASYYPGEPEVRYYADGSGYPGAPAEVELEWVEALAVTGVDYEWSHQEKSDWFDLLDEIIWSKIESNTSLSDNLSEQVFEHVADADDYY